jgi:UDP-glucose 4-epimerase
VYHLAAQAFVAPGEAYPYKDLDINGKGMLNMLRCIEEFDVPMVFTSSGSVYGLTDSFPHAEDALIRPTANYGCTKRLAELYLQKWVIMKGIDAKIVRFSSVYGPDRGKQGPVNIFLELSIEGKPLTVYGDGSQTRDMIHISDANSGVFHVLYHGTPGEIYNIGIGREHSVKEVAEIIAELTGVDLTFVSGHEFSPFDVKRSYYNIDKIKELGWSPKISLPVGILKTYKDIKRIKGL